ncbi:MAG TPA: sigma-54-dependent Fis family transcriptional regulator [Bacillus bacterium]|uniref:Sigma-54-dependent Fis family transcriptional regulator n=1 Tax=Siminovitchia fordii TaxID=254759 RepID=A0ABQ4K340_9BACI|nr:sigma-54-dependent Fis family transcriptional regulator [Siminovitchia fordii]GIN19533.1 sigma-54-dependent Fis family transcriptional regulator [Siminovitchia fordii]HBZ11597.1 sigma-54-dependent Fis family transcriptional regulator [Bacillus sp. (in: firmicutes)]
MSRLDNYEILNQLKYIDGITIADNKGIILFTIKFNPQFHSDILEHEEIVGESLFSVFPTLNEKTSTLLNAMKTGGPIFKDKQEFVDFRGRKIETTNISLPIKAHGKVIGAIELSKEISKENPNLNNAIEINSEMFKANKRLVENIQPERAKYTLKDIITNNEQMKKLKRLTEKIAKGSSPVFIYGETGTGKELFAQSLHNASNRAQKPFITQNCAAIPESLIESILFGTTKGSFTGAENNPGLFEIAEGGTIFLDEINSMPINLQSKLLRVLQDGYVRRLGDKNIRKIDVRVITASNKRPEDCVKDGDMRLDLYYRLCVMTLNIPPLRERKDDIKLLLEFFISKYNDLLHKNVNSISKTVYDFLLKYSWPGNVRELEHIVEYAINQIDDWEDTLQMKDIEERIKNFIQHNEEEVQIEPLKEAVARLERRMIEKAIHQTKSNVSQAAKLLGIPRQTLQNKIKFYEIMPKS